MFQILIALSLLLPLSLFAQTKNINWDIKNQWDQNFELKFQNFVETLGLGREKKYCRTLEE